MARRRRKGRGHKSKAIPVLLVAPPAYALLSAYKEAGGLNSTFISAATAKMTGYSPASNTFSMDRVKPFALGMIAVIIAHKVAGKVGINRAVKKATAGYLAF